jgi:hypothetical protein
MLSKKQNEQTPVNKTQIQSPISFGFSKQYLAVNRRMVDRPAPTPPPQVVSTGAKMKWGKPIWTFFHLLAHKVKDEDFAVIRSELLNTIFSICTVLPCPICSEHAKRYLQAINFNNIRTKQDLKIMLCNFHNDVNKRKVYAIFNAENLDETYDGMNFVNAINLFIYHFEDKHRSAKLMADDMMRKQISVDVKKWIMKNIQHFSP